MAERDWNAAEVCRRIPGMQNSFLSRILRSQQEFISKADLVKITNCFAVNAEGHKTPLDSAKIVRAHCMDECIGAGSEYVKVSIDQRGKPVDIEGTLSLVGEKALRFIRAACQGDEKFEALIVATARAYGMKH
jgi:hypothetical protein